MAEEGIVQYKDFLIVLLAAGIIVPLLVRLGVNTILGFLFVGVVLSPGILGSQVSLFPFLEAFVITDATGLAPLGDLGVVFLLFLIGLELSFERLFTMRRLVFGMGGVQVVLTTAVIFVSFQQFGVPPAAALLIGAGLSLSSTAIVIQLLSDEKRVSSQPGRVSFSILLLQDLAVIPILLLVSAMGRGSEGPLLQSIATALLGALVAVALIVGVGRYLLRPLLRMVAGTDNAELFMATVLLIAVGTGVIAHAAGLSMALGAFIAGLTLAETEYRRAIESIIEPFKGLLLGAFFLLIGLNLQLDGLLAAPLTIIGGAVLIVMVKAAVIYATVRTFGIGHSPALETALLLGPCGEFAFVIFAAAKAGGVLDAGLHGQLLLITTLTMMTIPLLAKFGRTWAKRSAASAASKNEAIMSAPPADVQSKIIVAGFGRVGRLLGLMLKEHDIQYIAIDSDATNAAKARKDGFPVYYGDATHPAFLERCGLAQAMAIAVTMDNPSRVDSVVKTARAARADIKIIARARDERHAVRLYELGVTEAVPETIEASLQLGESLLVEAGIAMGLAIASVHERRDGYRKLLGRPNRKKELERATLRRRRLKP